MVLETLVQNITSNLLWLSYDVQEELGGGTCVKQAQPFALSLNCVFPLPRTNLPRQNHSFLSGSQATH